MSVYTSIFAMILSHIEVFVYRPDVIGRGSETQLYVDEHLFF